MPFVDWLESLDMNTQLRIRNRITRIELGNFGDTKNLGDGVHELRFHFSSGYRVYFSVQKNRVVILISGGNKGSQRKDILKAYEYLNYYLKRGNNG